MRIDGWGAAWVVGLLSASACSAANWPGWRGKEGQGVSPEKNLPTRWSETEGVKWKIAIPGVGHSSPIVWGDRVFVTTAVADDPSVETFKGGMYVGFDRSEPDKTGYAYRVICLDVEDGRVVWSKPVREQRPTVPRHTKNSYASETPVTDGTFVFASFGAAGLHCLDFAGGVRWTYELGSMRTRRGWGSGSSPILFGSTVIVKCDSEDEGASYIAALDKATGDEVWRTEREEVSSWETPFLFRHDDRTVLVTNGSRRMRGYDPATGNRLWACGGGSRIVVPSPVSACGLVIVSSGFMYDRVRPLYAIRPTAAGDITLGQGQTASDAVAWYLHEGGAYVVSPIAVGDYLYVPLDRGFLTCYEMKTGREVYGKQRLGRATTLTGSPVAAEGRIYVQGEEGSCYVVKAGPAFEILAVNTLDEIFMASPAIADGKLYLRGRKHLYCIGG